MVSFFLEVAFRLKKSTAKLLNDASYGMFYCQLKMLSWSDPALYRFGLIAVGVAPARLSAYLMQIEKRIVAGWRLPPPSEGAQDYAAHEAQSGRIYFMKNSTHRRRGGATRVAISAGAAIEGKSDRRSAHGA